MGEPNPPTLRQDFSREDTLEQGADAPAGVDRIEPRSSISVSHRVGRYAILRKLGEGGMGVVYAAYDEELDRKVAVKLLRDGVQASVERRTRILREAQAMARVSHPNVVSIYEVGELDGQIFIAMEFIEGSTLADWQQEARSWDEVLRMYTAAGEGLLAAHQAGLVHRDFKPDNVLVGSDKRPRVADFGLARSKLAEEPAPKKADAAEQQSGSSNQLLLSPLTMAGTILGTPAYMSPEQHSGEPTDSRSDQFSFCAALYEALYKQLPFAGDTLSAFSFNVLAGRLRPVPHGSPVPSRIERALRRGLSVDPAQRFPSMQELLAALAIDLQRDPEGAPISRWLFSATMVLFVLATSVLFTVWRRHGLLTLHRQLLVVALQFVGAVVISWLLRGSLLRNTFHRGVANLAIILVAQATGIRVVAEICHFSDDQIHLLDLVVVGGIAAAMAIQYLPGAWGIVAVCGLGIAARALLPHHYDTYATVFYPGMALYFAILWNRSSGERPVRGAEKFVGAVRTHFRTTQKG